MPPRREARVTIKSVVLKGVRAGESYEDIAKQIIAQFPDSKGAQDPIRYIKYYVSAEGMGPQKQEEREDERERHGFQREITPLPKLKELLDQLIIDGVVINLYRGLSVTFDAAMKLSKKDVLNLYKAFNGEYARIDASYYCIQGAVVGEIQNRWYRAAGLPLPPQVEANQAQRLEDVKMAKKKEAAAEGSTATKEPRVTIKSVITAGLLAGKPDADIAKELETNFPGKAAAKNPSQHISYYRSALVKDGQLEKQPRKTKPKAEKAEAPAPAAAPAKGKKAAKGK